MAGFLDDMADSGLIGGLAQAGQGFMQGYSHAEDRKYKRMELEAKHRSEQLEIDRNKASKHFEQANKLRDDWLGNQTTKHSQTIKEAYDKIQTASPSAAGDMGLVFGYMKLLDPGSTVRESEYANASNTTGAAGKMAQLWNKVKDGQILTPAQRQQFRSEAAKIYGAQQKSQGAIDEQFGGLADTYQIPRNEIVLKIWNDPQTGEQKVIPVQAPAQPQIQGAHRPGLVSKPSPGLVQGGDQKSKEMLRMQELLKKKAGG